MSWSKADIDVETIYTSKGDNYKDITDDLIIVVERMIKNEEKLADNILIYTNATNGYLRLACYDDNTKSYIGQYIYHLELPELWENSLSHEEGAYHFDNETHIAICCMLEEYIDSLNIYTSNELNSTPEILYI
ncbi:hypothetical protein H9Q08_14345 [Chryseobacterium sp. PS-8]|jgi:hypothetical protein|uniref:Immunity protein Imm1 n=1 Tax=Chryseobacterium indicum TaxID=2766954 RepID=A0ABS9C8H2_9FLAO|nr:hypothetical protein [Chryseobacterium sp. PS-8]MCF2220464.1 hypothetical protein [Chryseobacterium sp. PS-8]